MTSYVKVGVDYCDAHEGIRNEDAGTCDMRTPTESVFCVLRPLYYDADEPPVIASDDAPAGAL